jgi:hypothetical protein
MMIFLAFWLGLITGLLLIVGGWWLWHFLHRPSPKVHMLLWSVTRSPQWIPEGVSLMADMQAGTSLTFGVKIVDSYGNVAPVENPAWKADPSDILTITASEPPVIFSGRPDQGLPKPPAKPDQGLPKPPGTPGHDLPNVPARPDQGLPSAPARPDQGLPKPPKPDQGLPGSGARPSHPIAGGGPTPTPLTATEVQYFATVKSGGKSGGAVLTFTGDSDMGDGVKELVGTVAITVLAGEAVSIEIAEVTGTPKK